MFLSRRDVCMHYDVYVCDGKYLFRKYYALFMYRGLAWTVFSQYIHIKQWMYIILYQHTTNVRSHFFLSFVFFSVWFHV